MDFAYCIRTKHECKKGLLFESLVCIVYIRERCYFSLVCTYTKAIKNYEVKIDVQKETLKHGEKLTIDVLVLSNTHSHRLLSYHNSPQ